MDVCAGVAHGAYNNDIEALLGIRELINYLPLSNREHAPIRKCDDPWSVHRHCRLSLLLHCLPQTRLLIITRASAARCWLPKPNVNKTNTSCMTDAVVYGA